MVGDESSAADALTHAKRLSDELNTASGSGLGRAIQTLSRTLANPVDPISQTEMSEAISDDDREIQLLEAERLMELGIIERERGRSNEAERCFRQALSSFQFHGNRIGEGRALGSIGLTFYQRGEVKGVEDLYRRSIQILMESGETEFLTKQLGNLANLYRSLGQFDLAIETFNRAIPMARDSNDLMSVGQLSGNLGNVFLAQGAYESAIQCYRTAVELAVEFGNRRSEGVHIGNLGLAHYGCGEFERAVEQSTLAIDIEREFGAQRGEGIHLGNMAEALAKLKRINEAIDGFEQAIALCEQSHPIAAGSFRGSLAWLRVQRGQVEESEALLLAGEAQVEASAEEFAKFLCKKGRILHFLGDVDGAVEVLRRAKGSDSSAQVSAAK